jgi:septal ring-binding cell division protein DamX
MNLRLNSVLVAAVCTAFPMASQAAEKLNVKLGLWEITSQTETRGMPPLPKELLDKLTPEQRRKMEADIKAEQAKGPEKDTDRECITQKDLEQPFESANTKECKQTIVTTTRTSQEVRIVCTGGVPGSGLLKVTTTSPEQMTGSLDLKLGAGAESMTINAKLQGRWLSADCGDEADDDESDADADADSDADADAGR